MSEIGMHLEAGWLKRKLVRVFLDFNNITYREHKGLLDSVFVCTVTPEQYKTVNGWIKNNKE